MQRRGGANCLTCAVVPAHNEAKSIENALGQLHRAGVAYVVVAANGCTDNTVRLARQRCADLFDGYEVLDIKEPLGHDVPRAVGAFTALRRFQEAQWFVVVDGDWQGGFGPGLEDCLHEARVSRCDVQFVNHREIEMQGISASKAGCDGHDAPRADMQLWSSVLLHNFPQYARIAAASLPLVLNRSCLAEISPYWLHHPGMWLSLCLLKSGQGLRVAAYEGWHASAIGNPARSEHHAIQMKITLLGDAVEGCCILNNRKPTRVFRGAIQDGYHSARRVDLLRAWQSAMRIQS